jgi:CubicO group peptidase (beta-lactamase class C family)
VKKGFKWAIGIIIFLIFLVYTFQVEYIFKGIRTVWLTGNNTAFISDYKYFDNREIIASNPQPWLIHKQYNQIEASKKLKEINKKRKTKSFLVIKNDSIVFEKYYDGYSDSSISNSFSVTKSIVVSMLWKAIMLGDVKGIDQPVSDFFDEYKVGLASKLTVGNLASMSSGMDWSEEYYTPINVTAESYFTKDLRPLMLNRKIVNEPGKSFKYLSGDTQLLGMVIEKATNSTLSDFLEKHFWNPMGAENNALWQIDSKENGMEKAYCCFSATARDFARFGKLYINKGMWDEAKILDSMYVNLSLKPVFENSTDYGYGWWLYEFEDKKVFTMNGHRGQFVISFPDENIIIVRQGENIDKVEDGKGTSDIKHYMSEGYKIASSIN